MMERIPASFLRLVVPSLLVLGCVTRAGATDVAGTISADTTWTLASSPYQVTQDITVAAGATLTIEPGVTVQFARYRGMWVRGSLYAVGTSASQIAFTGTTATADWWGTLTVDAAGSANLQWCDLRWAGYSSNVALLKSGSGGLTLRNSTISNIHGDGLVIYPGSASLTSSSNTFSTCWWGVRVASGASFDDPTSDFSGNSGDVLLSGGNFGGAAVWGLKSSYSLYVENNITVDAGASLTIRPSTVVKFALYGALYVDGTLDARGTAAALIHFTDWRDDTVGGDANRDGSASAAAPGWWWAMHVRGAGVATLEWCRLAYAGYSSGFGLLKTGSGALSLTHCTLSRIAGNALNVSGSSGAVLLQDSTFTDNTSCGLYMNSGSVTATACVFSDNADYGIYHEVNDSLVYSDNTFTGNYDGSVGSGGGTMDRDTTWTHGGGDPFTLTVVTGDITVAAGKTLTVAPGVTVRFARYRAITVNGTLHAVGTPDEEIVFAGTTETPGWWFALMVQNSGSATLDCCRIAHAGYGGVGILKTGSGALALTNSSIRDTNGDGLRVSAGSSAFTSAGNLFAACTYGVHLGIGVSFVDSTSDFQGNSIDVYADGGAIDGVVAWQLKPDYSIYLSGSLTINPTGTLDLRSGTVVKFVRYGTLTVGGALNAAGTPAAPVAITDWRDDSVGGDANHDGAASAPSPGWWLYLSVEGSGTAALTWCQLAYAGYSSGVGLWKTGSGDLSLENTTIRNIGGDGLRLDNSTGNHDLRRSVFTANTTGIRARNMAAGVTLDGCHILGNTSYGVFNEATPAVDARTCWWGHASGPRQPTLNALGQGNPVSNGVLFEPWLRSASFGLIIAPLHSGTIMQGDTLRFLGDPAAYAPGNAYDWDFGDGRKAPVLSPGLVTFPAAGERTVAFSVSTDGLPGASPDRRLVTVVPAAAAPDLKISAFTVPGDLAVGSLVTLRYTVTNAGSAAVAARGSWSDAVYLSDDDLLDLRDIPLASATISRPLAVGESYAGALRVRINATAEGRSHLILVVDDHWEVLDQHRLNGEKAAQTVFGVPVLVTGTASNGQFGGVTDTSHLYRINVSAGQSLSLALTGNVRAYLRFAYFPTFGQYDYSMSSADGGTITVPMAYPGTWYVLMVPDGSSTSASYTLRADVATLLLSTVLPAAISNAVGNDLSLTGAGFSAGTAVQFLPAAGGAAIAASAVRQDSAMRLTASLAAGLLPAGVYHIQALDSGSIAQVQNALTVSSGGTPRLTSRLVLPGRLGYHGLGTLYIEYANEGTAPMPAPLIILSATQNGRPGALLTLDQTRLSEGFWTSAIPRGFSNSVAILGSGRLAGVLQAGESIRTPVYYAGWQKPWDMGYPPFDFRLSVIPADHPAVVPWDSLKDSMRPAHLTPALWDALFPLVRARVGATWGALVRSVAANASHLARLGREVNDVSVLLGMAYLRAEGISADQALTMEVDAVTQTASLTLGFGRVYPVMLSERLRMGWFGKGWGATWDMIAQRQTDGTVVITSPGCRRGFKPDSRGGYLAGEGNPGVLAELGGGALRLTESNGRAYDFAAAGRLERVSTPNGDSITLTHTAGKPTGLVHSAGPSLALTYGGGTVDAITDDLGHTTSFAYDASRTLLLSVTTFDGLRTQYAYHVSANPLVHQALAAITYPDGTSVGFEYNADGHLVRIDNGAGEWITYAYGPTGVVTMTDALGRSAEVTLDQRGIPATSGLPSGALSEHLVGVNLCLERVADPSGRSTTPGYDSRNNLVRLVDAAGAASTFTYDTNARVTSSVDAKGNQTSYSVSHEGRVSAITDAAGTSRTFVYDGQGRLGSDTNRRNQPISYEYSAQGLLTRTAMPDGAVYTYAYDSRGNLTAAADANGTIAFTYDAAERLTRVAYPDDFTLDYQYDGANRRTRLRDQDGREVNYHYDADGRLASLTNESGILIVRYTYDTIGRLAQKDYGDGSYATAAFDADDRVTRMAHFQPDATPISSFDYSYDAAGWFKTIGTPEGSWSFTHDQPGNLTAAAFASSDRGALPDVTLAYRYDAVGNRIQVTTDGTEEAYGVNALNQYTQAGTATFAYDADGNLVSTSSGWQYIYDAVGRVRRAEQGADVWQWTYNALGQMATVTHNGQTTRFVYDPFGEGELVGEYDGAGGFSAFYAHGLELAAKRTASGSFFYHYDVQGNTTEITGGPGAATVNQYRYLPFGQALLATETVSNPFRFTGYAGAPTFACGLVHMGARDYLPALGRFIQPDPIGIGGGMNLYAYANNQPLEYDDPTGFITGSLLPIAGVDAGSGAGLEWVLNQFTSRALSSNKVYTGCTRGFKILREVFQKGTWVNGRLVSNAATAQKAAALSRFSAAVKAKRIQEAVSAARTTATTVRTVVTAGEAAGGTAAATGATTVGGMGVAAAASLGLVIWTAGTGVVYGAGYLTGSDTLTDAGGAMWDAVSPDGIAVAWDYYFGDSDSVQSEDPNAKTGPAGYGPEGWISGDQLFAYRIDFENFPTALAPAQVVTVTDPLDANLDWDTFEITGVGFADRLVAVPAHLSTYETTIAFEQDGKALELRVRIALNRASGRIEALFATLDPETGLPPAVDYGFLPAEDGTGRGKGSFSYVIRPRAGLATGTPLKNIADIAFDFSTTIATNQIDPRDAGAGTDAAKECRLTLDADPPTSAVAALPAQSPRHVAVSWAGNDAGAGVDCYTVYVQDNGGPFTVWMTTPATSATFPGLVGHTYGFYCVATDNAGTREAKAELAETSTAVTTHRVVFEVGDGGGTISGNVEQVIDHGDDAEPVEAMPDSGHVFGTWSLVGSATSQAERVLTLRAVTADQTWRASFRVAGAVVPNGTFLALSGAAGSAAGRLLWDLTGAYSTTVKGNSLTLNLLHDPTGRLCGTATYTVAKDSPVSMPIKGSIKGSRGSITMEGSLKGADPTRTVSVSLSLNLTVDTANRQLVGRLTGSVKTGGATTPVDDPIALHIPAPMDGTWTLSFDLDQTGRTVTGSAELKLSNDVEHTFVVSGKTGANSTALLTLSGAPADPTSKAIAIRTTITPLEGGWARIEGFSGRGYGQVIGW